MRVSVEGLVSAGTKHLIQFLIVPFSNASYYSLPKVKRLHKLS